MDFPSSRGPVPPLAPPEVGGRAIDNLRFIRETMERAGQFTAVPGWVLVAMGLTALVTAAITSHLPAGMAWLATWLALRGELLKALRNE